MVDLRQAIKDENVKLKKQDLKLIEGIVKMRRNGRLLISILALCIVVSVGFLVYAIMHVHQ